MPHWNKSETRPQDACIIAWEVYGGRASLLNEQEAVRGLQALADKDVVRAHCPGHTFWWVLN